jgi:hypothetical protein
MQSPSLNCVTTVEPHTPLSRSLSGTFTGTFTYTLPIIYHAPTYCFSPADIIRLRSASSTAAAGAGVSGAARSTYVDDDTVRAGPGKTHSVSR